MVAERVVEERLQDNLKWYEDHFHIRSEDGVIIPFKLNKIQVKLERAAIRKELEGKPAYFLVLKARQEGVSTWSEAYLFRMALERENTRVLVIAHTEDASRNLFGMTTRYYENLPEDMKPDTKRAAVNALHLESNDSEFIVQTAGSGTKAGRSYTFSGWHGCFPGSTPILSSDGRVVRAEDIEVGDPVITHTGQHSFVSAVTKRENDIPCFRITPWLGEGIELTANHKVFTKRGWLHARELRPDDQLQMPIRPIRENQSHWPDRELKKSPPRGFAMVRTSRTGSGEKVEFNEEFGFFVGYFLAEGCLVRNRRGQPASLTFARHRDESTYGDRAWGAVKHLCSSRTVADKEDCLTTTEQFFGAALAEWVSDNLYRPDKVVPDWVFSTSKEFAQGLVAGYLSGDGSKVEEMFSRVRASSIRSSISTQIRDLVLSLGIGWGRLSYEPASTRGDRNNKEKWTVSWSGDAARALREMMWLENEHDFDASQARCHTLVEGDNLWMKIRKIEPVECDEVYDFEVAHDDHSLRTAYFSISNSEIDNWPDAHALFVSVMQSIPKLAGTIRIFESTSEGPGHLMHELWKRTQQGRGDFEAFFFPWFAHEKYSKPLEWEDLISYGPTDFVAKYRGMIEAKKGAQDAVRRRAQRRDERRGDAEGSEGTVRRDDAPRAGADGSEESSSGSSGTGESAASRGHGRGASDSRGRNGDARGRTDDAGNGSGKPAAAKGRRGKGVRRGRRAAGSDVQRHRGYRHACEDQELVELFCTSLTDYEMGLLAEFPEEITLEQINSLRFLLESECNGDENKRMREYPSRPEEAFAAAGGDVLDQQVLADWWEAADKEEPLLKKITFTPEYDEFGRPKVKWQEDRHGHTTIFEWPDKEKAEKYVMFVDCAEGVSTGDWHVAYVMNVRTGEQAAEYRSKDDPDVAVDQIEMLGILFNRAFTGVEINGGYGWPFVRPLEQRKGLHGMELYERESLETIGGVKRKMKRPGWDTNTKTRPIMVSEAKQAVRKRSCRIRSKMTIEECQTLHANQSRGGKIEARNGYHDDGFMGFGGALCLRKEVISQHENLEKEVARKKNPLLVMLDRQAMAQARMDTGGVNGIDFNPVVPINAVMPADGTFGRDSQ